MTDWTGASPIRGDGREARLRLLLLRPLCGTQPYWAGVGKDYTTIIVCPLDTEKLTLLLIGLDQRRQLFRHQPMGVVK